MWIRRSATLIIPGNCGAVASPINAVLVHTTFMTGAHVGAPAEGT